VVAAVVVALGVHTKLLAAIAVANVSVRVVGAVFVSPIRVVTTEEPAITPEIEARSSK
jgi:hypothetical protein